MRRTRNPVYGYTVSWVRIPPLPPLGVVPQAIRVNKFSGHTSRKKNPVQKMICTGIFVSGACNQAVSKIVIDFA